MRHLSRTVAAIGLTIGALPIAAGCSHRTPDYVTAASMIAHPPQPSASSPATPPDDPNDTTAATPSSPSSAPPLTIPRPVDTTRVAGAPCTTIPEDAVASWSFDPGQQTTVDGAPSCLWQLNHDKVGTMTLSFGAADLTARYYTAQHTQPGSAQGGRAVLVQGYPAIAAAAHDGGHASCDVDVAVAPQKSFHLHIDGPATDTCAMTQRVAGNIAESLPPAH